MCKYKFKYLFAKVNFDYIEDHFAFTYIMKSKTELASTRIKILLEVFGAYSFNFYYMKDITLSDFLSRIKVDKFNTWNHSNFLWFAWSATQKILTLGLENKKQKLM